MSTGSDPSGLPLLWDKSVFMAATCYCFVANHQLCMPVPVYDAHMLCMDEVDIQVLQSYTKNSLKRLGKVDIGVGSFVGIVHCAKWIPSMKHSGKDRVQLGVAEIYLLVDPEFDE